MLKLNSHISEYSFLMFFFISQAFRLLSSAVRSSQSSARGFFHVEMQEEISQGPDNLMRKQILSAQDGSRSLVLGLSWDPKRFASVASASCPSPPGAVSCGGAAGLVQADAFLMLWSQSCFLCLISPSLPSLSPCSCFSTSKDKAGVPQCICTSLQSPTNGHKPLEKAPWLGAPVRSQVTNPVPRLQVSQIEPIHGINE